MLAVDTSVGEGPLLSKLRFSNYMAYLNKCTSLFKINLPHCAMDGQNTTSYGFRTKIANDF